MVLQQVWSLSVVLQQYLNNKLLMNYVTDRKQIGNNTIIRVITNLSKIKQ